MRGAIGLSTGCGCRDACNGAGCHVPDKDVRGTVGIARDQAGLSALEKDLVAVRRQKHRDIGRRFVADIVEHLGDRAADQVLGEQIKRPVGVVGDQVAGVTGEIDKVVVGRKAVAAAAGEIQSRTRIAVCRNACRAG